MQPVRSGRLPKDDGLDRVRLDAAFGKSRSRYYQNANKKNCLLLQVPVDAPRPKIAVIRRAL
jgi:hypothetical protein